MSVVKESNGTTNIYAKEPIMSYKDIQETTYERAEKVNGRAAMLGVIAAIGAYCVTGQLVPGVF